MPVVDQPFVMTVNNAPAGLVGTLAYRVQQGATVIVAPQTAGIVYLGGGVYQATVAGLALPGVYTILWHYGTATDASEDFTVYAGLGLQPVTGDPLYPQVRQALARSVATQRALAGRDFTAAVDFADTEEEAPTVVTLTLVNLRGQVVAGPIAAAVAGSVASVVVLASTVPQLDRLVAVWAHDDGVLVTEIDVRARRLFTVPQLAAAFPEVTAKGAARIENERRGAEDFLEAECGQTFAPAFAEAMFPRQMRSDWRRERVELLERWPVTALRYVLVDGVPLTDVDLALVAVEEFGQVRFPREIGVATRGALQVGFEHGGPVADVGRVAMILARHRLVRGPLDDRKIGLPVEGGGVVALLTPGVKGSVTGIPEVDQFLLEHRRRDRGVA